MTPDHDKSSNLISIGAMVALVGFVLSGPASFIIIRVVRPQPTWVSSSVFVENYHIIQDIPYYFGFLLIGGMLKVSVGHYMSETAKECHIDIIGVGWIMTTAGLVAYFLWNLLMIFMMVAIYHDNKSSRQLYVV
ncbi:MAG TPA: hypothetical protein VFG46_29125 [Chryseolinea sp.]|nr:hypothetical protein [Chryseolinea sp.]